MKLYYALRIKNEGALKFICAAETRDKHQKLVSYAKSNWEGMQPRGSKADYFDNVERVFVTVETETEYKQRLLDEKAEAEERDGGKL